MVLTKPIHIFVVPIIHNKYEIDIENFLYLPFMGDQIKFNRVKKRTLFIYADQSREWREETKRNIVTSTSRKAFIQCNF